MEIVLNFALTFSLIMFIMVIFSQISEAEEELQIVTNSHTYGVIGGFFTFLAAGSWFIFFLCLIWA